MGYRIDIPKLLVLWCAAGDISFEKLMQHTLLSRPLTNRIDSARSANRYDCHEGDKLKVSYPGLSYFEINPPRFTKGLLNCTLIINYYQYDKMNTQREIYLRSLWKNIRFHEYIHMLYQWLRWDRSLLLWDVIGLVHMANITQLPPDFTGAFRRSWVATRHHLEIAWYKIQVIDLWG